MATVSAGRSAAHAHGKHRRTAARSARTERLLAVESAYLAAFAAALALALRFPETAAVLCGLGGVTARTGGRQAARLTARFWDRGHQEGEQADEATDQKA
jgi:hypothetical protein